MGDRERQPAFVAPMLLTSGPISESAGWTFEVKWDGCRAQLRYDARSVSVRTRTGRECSEEFPELAAIAEVLGRRCVTLDGELVCLRGDGRPDFAPLRRRLAGSARNPQPVTLQVFDVLHLDGYSTRSLPYRERRTVLDELRLYGPAWRTPASVVVDTPDEFVARVAEFGLEGVIAKRLDSRYLPGRRSRAWMKHKLRRDERLAVTGIRRSPEGRAEAIFVARRMQNGSTRSAGAIEFGLRREIVEDLEQRLAGLPGRRRGAITWYPADVSVVASLHGLPDGPVRDATLRKRRQLIAGGGLCRQPSDLGSFAEAHSEPTANIRCAVDAFSRLGHCAFPLQMRDFARRCVIVERPLTAETRVRIPVAVSHKSPAMRRNADRPAAAGITVARAAERACGPVGC
jgi:bifunctional non-homologous end joining protein LigD